MPITAVPNYLGRDFSHASPGLRFGMYLKFWGVNRRTNAVLWTTHDVDYEVRGQQRQEREVEHENKVAALNDAKRLNENDKKSMRNLLKRQRQAFDVSASPETKFRLDATATAPFTTGLGNEHPLENGFSFLNPYGLPYLPGSGVKGVLRQAARELVSGEWGDSNGWDEAAITALFGKESGNGDTDHQRGALSFWDVIPQIEGDSLMAEIMTPHQAHYYQSKKDQRGNEIVVSPHECGQPNPISFLTVPPGSGFTFHVLCDTAHLTRLAPDLTANQRWKDLLTAAFEHAFGWLGFGAKTAVGYGAMSRLSDEEVAAARVAAEQAALKCEWVDETLRDLAKKHNAKEIDILRGKALAEAWATLTDPALKKRALADIRARWQAEGWWDSPPGRSAKAKAIYEGGE